jgi:ABC-2 type transport system permease protein
MPIFDQGYQHWTGRLSGHGWRWLAIARHGVRSGFKIKAMRLVLFLAWAPALSLAAVLCMWGLLERKSAMITTIMQFLTFINPGIVADPHHYRVAIWTLSYHYFLATELRASMLLILLVGPTLISQDLRFNALPLYFSRPLRRIDYFAGKLGVIGAFLGMVVIAPSVIAYVLGLLFSLDLTILRDTFGILLSSIAYGLIITLSAGLLILALSSLSRSSRYVALLWMGIWFLSSVTSGILQSVDQQQQRQVYMRQEQRRQWSDMNAPSQERLRQWQLQQGAWRAEMESFDQHQIESSKTDWRPLVSYTANLSRVGDALLGTNASWESLSTLEPPDGRDRFLWDFQGPRYPWHWSAAVLIALFGLSACTLNIPVKSLDRLK